MATHHLAGGKYSRRHSTIIDAAVKPIQAAAKLTCVRKVALGCITAATGGSLGVKFAVENPTCLRVTIRGVRYLQEVRIYHTGGQDEVEATIRAALDLA